MRAAPLAAALLLSLPVLAAPAGAADPPATLRWAYRVSIPSPGSGDVHVEVSIDGGPWTKHRARTVVIGNVGYLQAGIPLLPDATLDDGILDAVILHPRRFLSWIPLAVRIMSKARRTDETVNRMTGRTISVRAAHDTPRQLDGDAIGAGKELHAEVLHGKLLVRVPR